MKRWCAGLAVLLLSAGAAWADSVSPAPDAVSVTIYHADGLSTSDLVHPEATEWFQDQGLALITETREVDLPAGPSEIRFRGVASSMVPQTATIDGLPSSALEQNFDYDLLSPGSLLAKSIGSTVHLIRTDPKTGRETDVPAVVRTGPDGAMLDVGGKLEALRCSGLPERLVFEKTPEGLSDTPTLAVRTNAPVAGHYTIKLTYIATSLNWSADYVATVKPGGNTLDLIGWLTLANFGTTGFGRVPVAAVAGRLNTTGDDTPIHPQAIPLATRCWPMGARWWKSDWHALGDRELAVPVTAMTGSLAPETVVVTGSRIPDARQLADYKIYDLPEPTDMPAHETKQVQFLDLHDVPFERMYTYAITDESGDNASPASLILKLKNTAEGGLGKPLPAGTISVTEPGPDGSPIFVGQSPIKDTPVGLPVEIATGEIFSVLVTEAGIEDKKIGSGDQRHTQHSMTFDIVNNRADTTPFALRQYLYSGQVKILSESLPHVVDGDAAEWRMMLKPGERVQVQLTVDLPY